MSIDPKQRFSNRVEDYIKYRPNYPEAVIPFLQEAINLWPEMIVADIGSGTGILSETFLKNGNRVFGVEPNKAMRTAAEELLKVYPAFTSVDGAAEATTLESNSIDLITAGQAFHWFDIGQANVEFGRILKLGGWVVLIWNVRIDSTPFAQAYEQVLLDYGLDYRQVNHRNVSDKHLPAFFDYRLKTFANFQRLDYEGLAGRLLSSSYAPLAGHPNHEPMLVALREVFEAHQVDGFVRFEYETHLYYGRL